MGLLKKSVTYLTLVLILMELLAVLIPFTQQAIAENVSVVSYSVTSSTGGKVYPGSKGASIVVQLRNDESSNISVVQGCFSFNNPGIKISGGRGACVDATTPDGKHKTEFTPGEIFQLSTSVDVDKNVSPGTYWMHLNVSYTVNGNRVWRYFNLRFTVSPYPPVEISALSSWWGSEEVYPGTSSATLYIRLRNDGSTDIRGGTAVISVPEPLKPREIHIDLPSINSGDEATIQVSGVDIPITTEPGNYTFIIKYNATASTDDGVTYQGEGETSTNASINRPEVPDVRVIDEGWVGAAYNDTRNAAVYVTLQNLDHSRIESIVAELYLPPGVTTREGETRVVTSATTPVGFGDLVTLRFEGINLSAYAGKEVNFTLTVNFLANYNGAEYYVSRNYTIPVNIVHESILAVKQVRWVTNGNTAEALPSSKGITLEITLTNYGTDTVTAIIPKLVTGQEFTIRSFSGQCVDGIAPGSTCRLDFTVDVSNKVSPGPYPATLNLEYLIRSGNALLHNMKSTEIYLVVDDPEKYIPNLVISRCWWGTSNPSTAYGMERMLPAHVEIANLGRYPASYLFVNITPLTKGVKVIEGKSLCANELSPGTACRVTPYVDLGNFTGNDVRLRISIYYYLTLYGAYIPVVKNFTADLEVEKYASLKEGPLTIVSEGWGNGYPVYPNTQNATYSITLANHYPYSISSIMAFLELPRGFRLVGLPSYAYVPGPIASEQTASMSFTISVGDVKPGDYRGNLTLMYVVNSGGASVLNIYEATVMLKVEGFGPGIEYISSGWYGRPAQPGTYGNMMYVVFRNDVFPSMKGVVADVRLPPGFTSSINNASTVKVPASTSLPQVSSMGNAGLKGLPKEVVSSIIQQAQPVQTLSKGDLIYFLIPVNVLNVSPGTYRALMNISFLDQWGNVRCFSLTVPLSVLGAPFIIKVWSDDVLSFNDSRMAVMHVKVLNEGSAPVYNVYMAIYSPNQYMILLPKTNPMYLGELYPGKTKVVNVTVFFNPIVSPQIPTPITYGNVPFMTGIMYTDVLGNMHTVNASFTVSIQPFIKLVLQDVKVRKEGNEIKASATVTNLGNAQAQRLTARIVIGNYSGPEEFIGDLDPSSQTSFSASATYEGSVKEVRIVISYRNPYNELRNVSFTAPVTEVNLTTTTTSQPSQKILDIYKVGIVLGVIAFLSLSAIAIHKYLKKHPLPRGSEEEEF